MRASTASAAGSCAAARQVSPRRPSASGSRPKAGSSRSEQRQQRPALRRRVRARLRKPGHRHRRHDSAAFDQLTAQCFNSGCFASGRTRAWSARWRRPAAGRPRPAAQRLGAPVHCDATCAAPSPRSAARQHDRAAARSHAAPGRPRRGCSRAQVLRVQLDRRLGRVAEQPPQRAGAAHAVPLVAQAAGGERDGWRASAAGQRRRPRRRSARGRRRSRKAVLIEAHAARAPAPWAAAIAAGPRDRVA